MEWYCHGCVTNFSSDAIGEAECPNCGGMVYDLCMEPSVHGLDQKYTDVDMVEKPPHYQKIVGDMEAINIIEGIISNYDGHMDLPDIYCIGQCLKYLLRAPFKGKLDEDLKKSYWYLGRVVNGAGD